MSKKILSPNDEYASIKIKIRTEDTVTFETYDSDFPAEFDIQKKYTAETAEYNYHFFYKNGLTDTDVYQLRLKANEDPESKPESVGWCASISSLDNLNHQFSDNKFYRIFASSLFDFLILDSKNSKTPKFKNDRVWSISDFYEKNISIVAISKKRETEIKIDSFIPFLFSLGYFSYQNGVIFSDFSPEKEKREKYIEILSMNEDFRDNSFVINMFKNVLTRKIDSLAAFLLNYQIYEQMIHISFESKLSNFKKVISEFSGTSSDLKDAMKNISKINDELSKLKDYINTLDFSASMLNGCGKKFKGVHQNDEKEDFPSSLYAARNKILHNYRNLSNESINAIDEMNKELFKLTPILICARKATGVDSEVEVLPEESILSPSQEEQKKTQLPRVNPISLKKEKMIDTRGFNEITKSFFRLIQKNKKSIRSFLRV